MCESHHNSSESIQASANHQKKRPAISFRKHRPENRKDYRSFSVSDQYPCNESICFFQPALQKNGRRRRSAAFPAFISRIRSSLQCSDRMGTELIHFLPCPYTAHGNQVCVRYSSVFLSRRSFSTVTGQKHCTG